MLLLMVLFDLKKTGRVKHPTKLQQHIKQLYYVKYNA